MRIWRSARERGITVAEAQQRLGWQALTPDLAERVEASLRGGFGGVWIDSAPETTSGPVSPTGELALTCGSSGRDGGI